MDSVKKIIVNLKCHTCGAIKTDVLIDSEIQSLCSDCALAEQPKQRFDPYGTHIPVLAAAIHATSGHVLEMGCGDYSTYLIDAMLRGRDRSLTTVESDRAWLDRYADLISDWHKLVHVTSWFDFDLGDTFWDVALIDHAPAERRIMDIARLKKKAKFLVVHDTEDAQYGYESAFSKFKFRKDYKRLVPWTTVVSDFEEIAFL